MADKKILLIGSAIALVALVAGGAWLSFSKDKDQFAQCRSSNVAGGLDSFGTDFTLTATDGNRITAAQVFDKPSLLYFGYTFCPDVCPMDSARNAEAEALLLEQGRDVQTVFITVDPKRDTPEVVKDFVANFSDRMIGLTGSEDEIASVNKGWRNYFRLNDEDDQEYYLVDHMTNTYLVLPGNQTVEFFPRDASAEDIAEKVACYMDAA